MRFSVITVTYNSASTLRRALESVACQSYREVEHIVIDGGSTDGTTECVRAHGRHVAAYVSEPDRGIYDAMNKGLSRAQGDVIAFLNADDRYASTSTLQVVADFFAEHDVDAALGDVAYFRPEAPHRIVRRYRSDRFAPNRLGWGWMPAHPAMFVRRKVYDCVGPFRTDFRIAGDYEWIARAFTRCEVRHRHLPQTLVEMQTGGISTQGWRNTWLLNREVLRACRLNGIQTNWVKLLSKYPLKAMEYVA